MNRAPSATRRRIIPLRSFDRVVAGYATSAFALGGGHSIMTREWPFAVLGFSFTVAGVALLLADHRRWRAERRAAQQ